MDGFGEIIYIIVMIVIFIFSALKKKKPKEHEMPAPEDRESENPFDEVFRPFREIFEDEDTQPHESPQKNGQPEPAMTDKGSKNLKDAPFVKEDYVFTANTSPGDARRQRKNRAPGRQEKLKSEEQEGLNREDERGGSGNDWFNLREAVIYSEILKRPDY